MGLLSILQAAQQLNQPRGIAMPGQIMEPQSPNYGDLSDPNLRNARQDLLSILAAPPQMQAPADPVQPAFRTPDAITGGLALLAALLGGRGGREFAQGAAGGWAGAKQGKAQQDTQTRQRQIDFQNQQTAQDYNAQANVAKAKLGFVEDDDKRAYSERAQKQQDAALLERVKATQEGQTERAKIKADSNALNQKIKAVGLRYNVGREAAIDILFDQGLLDDEMYASLRSQVAKKTTGEVKDDAQAKNIESQMKARDAELDKKLRKYDDEHKKVDPLIKKWEADTKIKQQNANTARMNANTSRANSQTTRDRFEWQKKNPAGVSKVDREIFNLQKTKAGLLAEAETWKQQTGNVPGMIERNTSQSAAALAKIQRSLAAVDAKLKKLREFGGGDSVDSLREAAEEAIRQRPDKADFIRKRFKQDTGFDL